MASANVRVYVSLTLDLADYKSPLVPVLLLSKRMIHENSTLTTQEVKAAVEDTLLYLQQIVNDSQAWQCDISTEELETCIVTVKANAQRAIVRIAPSVCEGLMNSPLKHKDGAEEWAPLQNFADLLDFLIVHLCPAMCVPRAIYYIIHTMRLCLPPDIVDAQITIDEIDGEFTIRNPSDEKKHSFRLKVVDGQPTLHYGKAKMLKVPGIAPLEPDTDFVQHAFYKQPAATQWPTEGGGIRYVQHPDVARGLNKLLKKVGLAGMEASMKREAARLLLTIEPEKPARSARSSRSVLSAG